MRDWLSCGIKNVSRTGRARGGKALELQLSVQFIQARYFRINFAGAGQNAKARRREGGERGKVKLMRLLVNGSNAAETSKIQGEISFRG